MAAGTPQKRSRSSTGTDSSSSVFETPVKKKMIGFSEDLSPLEKPRNNLSASQIQWSCSSSDEMKENQAVPVRPVLPRRLDISPLQAASVPTALQSESSRQSPKTAPSYKLFVPVVSFYSKQKCYLTPYERRELNEHCSLGERNRDKHLPAASRTEKMNVSLSRKKSLKPTKHMTKSQHGKTVPKAPKKAKRETSAEKSSVEKENMNSLVKKKMESPFRVLTMTVKPALKLQLGAAFFNAGKKSHSKKPVVDAKFSPGLPKSLKENNQPRPPPDTKSSLADGNKVVEAGGILRSISLPQKKENENRKDSRSCVNQERDAVCDGKAPPLKSRRTSGSSCASRPAAGGVSNAENVDADEISSTACESNDGIILSSQSLQKMNKQASPSKAVVYPIFSSSLTSKKRTQAALDEATPPFGSSPPAKTSHTSQKNKKAKELHKRSRDQMIIDAGQKHFGAIVCKSCGMIYTAASPEDEAQHIQHHERFLEGLRYVGWKKERVVAEFWDGKVVLILPDDPKYAVKKAEDVREIVDNELGFKQVSLSCPAKTKIYLFVANEKMVVGCLVAESIKQAFRVLCEPGSVPGSPGQDALQTQRAWRCSTEPEPAICGVSRIWVFGPSRGKGIARRMVDVVRSTFMYGCYLSTEEIAFSDPTPDGKLFATKYCRTPNFLVYNFIYNN